MSALLTDSAVMMCPHGGTVEAVTSNTRVTANGDYLLRQSDNFTIKGCGFYLGATLHPCVLVQWIATAEKSQSIGDFNLTEDSVGLCVAADQAVQGIVQITSTQFLVDGI